MAIGDVVAFTNNAGTEVFSVDQDGNVIITGTFGSTSEEVGNTYYADSKGAYFGADQDGSLVHDGTTGLTLTSVALDINASGAVTLDGTGVSIDGVGVASNLSLTSNGAAQDLTIALLGATDSSLILSSTGTGADALQLTASAGGLVISSTATTASWTHTANGAADDLTIAVAGAFDSSLFLNSAGTGADAIGIAASAGGVDISAALGLDLVSAAAIAGWTHTSGGAGQDLTIALAGATDSSLVLSSTGTGADALQVTASAGGLVLTSANTTASWTHTANGAADDLTIAVAGAVDSSLFLNSAGTGADALAIAASAGGVDISAALGLDLVSAAAIAGWTHTSSGAGHDLTIALAGATDSSLVLSSTGTGADALQVNASAGGMDISAALGIDIVSAGAVAGWTHTTALAAQDLTIAVAGATDSSLVLSSTGTGADALQITASAGGLVLSSANTVAGWTHTADGAADDLTIAVAGAVDSSLVLSSAGTGADALRVTTSAGGIVISSAAEMGITATNGVIRTAGTHDFSFRNQVVIFDDFLYQASGTDADHPFIVLEGTDTQAAIDIPATKQEGGVITLTTGDTNGVIAADGVQLTASVPVQADSGGLVFEARLHINTAITNTVLFAGLTDVQTLEMPCTINATDVVQLVADDFAGFIYDTTAATDEWFLVAADSTVADAGNIASGTAPTADVFQTLRIEVSADGATISYYINGALEATLTGDVGVSPDVNLFATVCADANDGTSHVIDVDYIYCGVNR